MTTAARSFQRAQWGQWLVFVLAGALLLDGPVRVLVQVAGQTVGEKVCRHHGHQEVCPRNPNGPCTCTHDHDPQSSTSDSESLSSPAFEACNGGGADALSLSLSPLAWTPVAPVRPAPRISTSAYARFASSLSPQRVGDDVFRPPRTTPDVRLT